VLLPISVTVRGLTTMGATCNAASVPEPNVQNVQVDLSPAVAAKPRQVRSSLGGDTANDWRTGKEKARVWQGQLKQEIRQLDREVANLRREEQKLQRDMKSFANKGQTVQVQAAARNIVRLRKSVEKVEKTKSSMTAMSYHVTSQAASMSAACAVRASTAMMKEANQVLNVQEMQQTIHDMQAEMAKAQMAEELIEDALEDPDADEEADLELQRVYEEVALETGMLLGAPPVVQPAERPAAMTSPRGLPHQQVPNFGNSLDTNLGSRINAVLA